MFSSGTGRTGIFIGFDILLNESTRTGSADVYECVLQMRNQRVEMIRNCVSDFSDIVVENSVVEK